MMNIVGKILVFLNFLMAIIASLLVVSSVAVRTPWKEANRALLEENKVIRAQRETAAHSTVSIVSDYKQKVLELEQREQKLKDTEVQMQAQKVDFENQITNL